MLAYRKQPVSTVSLFLHAYSFLWEQVYRVKLSDLIGSFESFFQFQRENCVVILFGMFSEFCTRIKTFVMHIMQMYLGRA